MPIVIDGATVQFWSAFPTTGPEAATTSIADGYFEFTNYIVGQFDLFAFKAGYYPGLVENVNWGTTGIMIVLTPIVWVKSLGAPEMQPAASAAVEGYSNTRALGEMLYTQYLYPFELAAALLLIAIVGAITLTMRHRAGLKVQDVAGQVSVRARDRVRLVKVPAENKQ